MVKVFRSPRTSWAGFVLLLEPFGLFLVCVGAQFDGNAETVPDWTGLVAKWPVIVGAFGLMFARDNNVTSEEAGAK